METITFTATFTFPRSSIIGFAKFLGYPDTAITTDGVPEEVFDFIARLAKEHNEKFVTTWANMLVQEQVQAQVDTIKPQVEAQILQPVKDAIQVTYQ